VTESATILIVDDLAAARDTLKMLLSTGPYRIVEATCGTEALVMAQEIQPDLILLDVMMPGMDGYEVCRRLRAEELLAEVPVIMVTALEDRASRLRGLDAGADDFISKPYDTAELRARVRSITRLNRYRRLNAQRERFEWVVAHTDVGYLITASDDTIRYANARARHLLELPPGEEKLDTIRFLEATQYRYRREPEAAWRGWPSTEESELPMSRLLVRPETPTAPSCWLQVDSYEHLQGESYGRLIRLQDVTESLAAQRGNWTFQTMISHKLRTPLNGLLSCLEMINNDLDRIPPDLRDLLEISLTSVNRLHRDVLEVLRLSDRKSHRGGGRFLLDDLPELAERLSAELLSLPAIVTGSEHFAGRSLTLATASLETILTELFHNARKFHPGKAPQVTITVTPTGNDRITVTVGDDGATLTPTQLERAWAPYYQGEKYFTGEVPGMGLGLCLVATLVLESGGSYHLANRAEGPGVLAQLTLPLAEDAWREREGGSLLWS
jgi:two-component system, cell cycle response regulator